MKNLIKVSVITATMIATNLVSSDILATVDGRNITSQDAEAFVRATAPKASFAQLPENQQKMIAERLVERVLFIKAAKKEGVDKEAEFKSNMEKLKEELLVSLWMKKQMDTQESLL